MSKDAERALLGGLMLDNQRIAAVADMVRAEHFASLHNRWIYQAILDLHREGSAADIVLVTQRLADQGRLDTLPPGYLLDVADSCYVSSNVPAYARHVAEHGGLAEVRDGITRYAARLVDGAARQPEEALAGAEKVLAELWAKMPAAKPNAFGSLLGESIQSIQERAAFGLPTGFADLDELLGGLRPGEVVVVAGRPSMGKTSFANAIAANVAKQGNAVLYFSLETMGRQVALNIACARARVSVANLMRGKATEHDLARLLGEANALSQLPLYVNDMTRLTADAIIGKAKAFAAEHRLALVVLDYLQLCGVGSKFENRQQEIAHVSRAMKTMAMALHVPVLALSQLNRRVDADSDKRPKLSDLRESGAIEQDADVVMLLYRDDYYDPETSKKGICEVNIAKHRNGPVGVVELAFQAQYMRFDSLS